MHEAVRTCATECGWRIRALLRVRCYDTDAEIVQLYKTHILAFAEYRTAAIAHAASSTLAPLDAQQSRFLRHIGLSCIEALLRFGLAPLAIRRDIAVLGVVHRTVLEWGPPQFKQFFEIDTSEPPVRGRRHERHLRDPCAS
eukprot:3312355-Alexandrium_andersonii.AAC.1